MNYKRYIITFLITSTIFATAMMISSKLNENKLDKVRAIEDNMSIDILSLETQFDLLHELSCEQIKDGRILSRELNNLASKLSHMEELRGSDDYEVIRLKRRYSILQIKDLLLIRKITERCDISPVVILYFYSNEGDCRDCIRQGHVLTRLSSDFEELRVYAFDANLDLSALETLISIKQVGYNLPALVINDETHHGFMSIDEIKELLPELEESLIIDEIIIPNKE